MKDLEETRLKELTLQREREKIRLYNHHKNLDREKRKLEWKKMDIIAKEKIQGNNVDRTRAMTAGTCAKKRETGKLMQ